MISDRVRRMRTRAAMLMEARYLYRNRARMGYAEVRPMLSFHTPAHTVPAHPTDCSESLSMVARIAGAPTPYVKDNFGFTGTMLATLPHISFSQTRRGDFAVYVAPERPGGDHVVMLMQGGRHRHNPVVWSHGRPGVDMMPLSEMTAGFPGREVVFLRTVPERYTKAAKTEARKA
jgi:hypothetical protein